MTAPLVSSSFLAYKLGLYEQQDEIFQISRKYF
jgi:hypothetical protein